MHDIWTRREKHTRRTIYIGTHDIRPRGVVLCVYMRGAYYNQYLRVFTKYYNIIMFVRAPPRDGA